MTVQRRGSQDGNVHARTSARRAVRVFIRPVSGLTSGSNSILAVTPSR
jgi:hypothetical protein